MVWFAQTEDQSISLGFSGPRRQRSAIECAAGGPKGAPPTIPPIIINPYNHQAPKPAIDPRITPVGPPILPPPRPGISFDCA